MQWINIHQIFISVMKLCKTSHRHKCFFFLFAGVIMILLNQTVFSTWHAISEDTKDLETKIYTLTKEEQRDTVNRISANFASFKQKFNNDNEKYVNELANGKQVARINSYFNTLPVNASIYEDNANKEERVFASDDYHNYFAINNKLDHPLVNLHKYEFTLNNEYACNGNVFIVILVHSDPKKIDERNSIRETWGSVNLHSGATVVTMFLLAETNDEVLQGKLKVESERNLDIAQGNFVDSYRNLTVKCVMGLHWVEQFCNHTKFVLKVDDDTMIDVFHLVEFLMQKSPDGNLNNFLYCSSFKNQGPVRRTNDKWFVPNHEYPFAKYPQYCEGFAFLMSRDVSKKLYDATKEVQFYWIDDVYLTGLVALKADIHHKAMESGHSYNLMQEEHLSQNVKSVLFLLAKYSHHRKIWEQAWNDIMDIHK